MFDSQSEGVAVDVVVEVGRQHVVRHLVVRVQLTHIHTLKVQHQVLGVGLQRIKDSLRFWEVNYT